MKLMKVELIDHMGSDLTVVNAARVSFAKISKKLKSKDSQAVFVQLIRLQQTCLGGYENWEKAHSDRYNVKG